jgi:hypothetical protein
VLVDPLPYRYCDDAMHAADVMACMDAQPRLHIQSVSPEMQGIRSRCALKLIRESYTSGSNARISFSASSITAVSGSSVDTGTGTGTQYSDSSDTLV